MSKRTLYVSDYILPDQNDMEDIMWIGDSCEFHQGYTYCNNNGIEYTVFENIWKEKKDINQARDYIDKLVDEIIGGLSSQLNNMHSVNFNENDWDYLLRHWMLMYVSSFYDKFRRLSAINEEVIIRIPQKTEWLLCHTWDFCDQIDKEPYNLYQYSSLLKEIEFSNISISEMNCDALKEYINTLYGCKKANKSPEDWHKKIRRMAKARVLIYQCYLSDMINLFEKISLGKVIDYSSFGVDIRADLDALIPQIDSNIRNNLQVVLSDNYKSDSFARFISVQILKDIPYVFVEGWKELLNITQKYFGEQNRVKFIMTHSHYTDAFRLFVTIRRQERAQLAVVQHGGNYGLTLDATKGYAFKEADIFYTWGWKMKSYPCQFIPMPAAKLIDLQKQKLEKKGEGILYTNSFRTGKRDTFYAVRNFACEGFEQVEKNFFDILDQNVRQKTIFRAYRHLYDRGKEYMEYFEKKYPEMLFENQVPFYKALEECELLVANKISTTYLEALAINKPCIIFYPPEFYDAEKEAVGCLGKLKKAEILHDSEKSAAELINRIHDDIMGWWMEEERQQIVQDFITDYAYQTKNSKLLWIKEILKRCR